MRKRGVVVVTIGSTMLSLMMACGGGQEPNPILTTSNDFTRETKEQVLPKPMLEDALQIVPTVTHLLTPTQVLPDTHSPTVSTTILTPPPRPTRVPTQVSLAATPTNTPTPTWIPMTVEWESVTIPLKDDAEFVGYSDSESPVTWIYHMFVITNFNEDMGSIAFMLHGVDQQGDKIGNIGDEITYPYSIIVESLVLPKSTAVLASSVAFIRNQSLPHEWIIDTEGLEECKDSYESGGEDGECSAYVQTVNSLTTGGWGPWPDGKSILDEDPLQNKFFTLDRDWVINKTDAMLDVSYVCVHSRSLESLYRTKGIREIPIHLRPRFREFPGITHTRIAYGKKLRLNPGSKVMQKILSDGGQCGYWKVHH